MITSRSHRWKASRKPRNNSGSSNPGNLAVSLELPWGARNAGKHIESPVILLGSETLESQQKAQGTVVDMAFSVTGKVRFLGNRDYPRRYHGLSNP